MRLARIIPIGLILGVGIAARFLGLDQQSLWLDEALSLNHIQSASIHELYQKLITENVHPPIYYLLLRWWSGTFGDSEIALRSLSALASALALAVIGMVAKEAGGRRAAVTALTIGAASLYQIWFAQEVKGYALSILFAALSALFILRNERSPALDNEIFLFVSEVLLIFTHYMNSLFLGAHGLFALYLIVTRRSREAWRHPGVWPLLGAILCAGAWFYLHAESISHNREGVWFGVPAGADFAELFPRLLTYDVPWSATSQPLAPLSIIVSGVLLVLWFIASRGYDEPEAGPGLTFDFFWLLIPTAASWGLAQAGIRGFYFRTLALSSPALIVVLSVLISRMRPAFFALLSVALLVHASAALLPHYYSSHHKEEWREAAADISMHFSEGDPIVFPQIGVTVPFNYYFHRKYQAIPWEAFRSKPSGNSIWVVHAVTDIDLKQIAEAMAGAGYTLAERHDLTGIRIRRYLRKSQ